MPYPVDDFETFNTQKDTKTDPTPTKRDTPSTWIQKLSGVAALVVIALRDIL